MSDERKPLPLVCPYCGRNVWPAGEIRISCTHCGADWDEYGRPDMLPYDWHERRPPKA